MRYPVRNYAVAASPAQGDAQDIARLGNYRHNASPTGVPIPSFRHQELSGLSKKARLSFAPHFQPDPTSLRTDPQCECNPGPEATVKTPSMKLKQPLFALLALVTLASCVGRKTMNYLEDPALSNTAKLFPNTKFEYRIQVNDVLSIRVLGLDDATSRFFNVENSTGIAISDAAMYVNGFSVDKTGNVQLPTIGRVKVQGLTVSEAQDLIQRKINDYFTNATVILKMISFRVSVLGEVNAPGSYFIYNNQITLLDALARAGGPKEFADKRHITLMRQSDQGTQALYVDLSQASVLSSEYYYLLPNDVVYVPTLKARPGRLNLELLSVLFAAISAAAVVVTIVQNQSK